MGDVGEEMGVSGVGILSIFWHFVALSDIFCRCYRIFFVYYWQFRITVSNCNFSPPSPIPSFVKSRPPPYSIHSLYSNLHNVEAHPLRLTLEKWEVYSLAARVSRQEEKKNTCTTVHHNWTQNSFEMKRKHNVYLIVCMFGQTGYSDIFYFCYPIFRYLE